MTSPAACCFSHSPVGPPRELAGLFRRRTAWDDGAIREPVGAVAVAFPMSRCRRSGEDVGARAASVGKGWLMQADEVLYLHPDRVRLRGPAIDVDADSLPDVVLEVDHTTDAPAVLTL